MGVMIFWMRAAPIAATVISTHLPYSSTANYGGLGPPSRTGQPYADPARQRQPFFRFSGALFLGAPSSSEHPLPLSTLFLGAPSSTVPSGHLHGRGTGDRMQRRVVQGRGRVDRDVQRGRFGSCPDQQVSDGGDHRSVVRAQPQRGHPQRDAAWRRTVPPRGSGRGSWRRPRRPRRECRPRSRCRRPPPCGSAHRRPPPGATPRRPPPAAPDHDAAPPTVRRRS